jgi:HEAT repeat protein
MCEGRVLFTTEVLTAAVRSVLASRGYTGREQDAEVPRFIDAARDAIGVVVEQAPDRFGFVHLTFQEFLAARALVRRGQDAPELIRRFWDHPDWQETWLLYALGCQAQQGRYSALIEIILSEVPRNSLDKVLRRQERLALRLAGVGTEVLPAVINAALDWAADALVHNWWQVRDILGAWERTLPQNLRDRLLPYIKMRYVGVRVSAVRNLASHADDPTVRRALLAASKDRSPLVRAEVLRAFVAISDDTTVRDVLIAACQDRSETPRSAAVEVLAAFAEDISALKALLRGLDDKSGWVRHTALHALAPWADDPGVLPALLRVTRDEYPYIRNGVIRILADCASDRVITALLGAARDPPCQ